MHQECIQNDHLFVGHRQKDKHLSYSHEGWSALTLHGLRADATENCDQYGLTERDYKWTDICEYFPTCVQFLKKLGYQSYERVRIMRLAPGGYIMPHSDGDGRVFGPLNIAINNPAGCNFYFEKWGKVPFKPGTGFFLDIGNVHAVYNNSDEPRYHFIVHGHINNKLIENKILIKEDFFGLFVIWGAMWLIGWALEKMGILASTANSAGLSNRVGDALDDIYKDKELVKDFVIILKKAGDIDSIAKDALSDLKKRRRFEYRPEEDGNDRWVNRTDWEEHINRNIDEFEWTKSARDIAHDVVKSQGYIKFSKKHKFNSKDDIVMKELFYFIVTRPDFAKTAKMYLYKAADKSIPSDVKAVNLKDLLPRRPQV